MGKEETLLLDSYLEESTSKITFLLRPKPAFPEVCSLCINHFIIINTEQVSILIA